MSIKKLLIFVGLILLLVGCSTNKVSNNQKIEEPQDENLEYYLSIAPVLEEIYSEEFNFNYKMAVQYIIVEPDLDKGAEFIDRALELYPEHFGLYILLGKFYENLGVLEYSFDSYQEALKMAPDNTEEKYLKDIMFNMILVSSDLDNLWRTKYLLGEATKYKNFFEEYPFLYILKAKNEYYFNEADTALATLDEFTENNEINQGASYLLAKIWQSKGDYVKALFFIDKHIEFYPVVDSYVIRANILHDKQDYEAYMNQLHQIYEMDATNAYALYHLAEESYYQNDFENSHKYFTELIAVPEIDDAYFNFRIAQSNRHLQNLEQAEKYIILADSLYQEYESNFNDIGFNSYDIQVEYAEQEYIKSQFTEAQKHIQPVIDYYLNLDTEEIVDHYSNIGWYYLLASEYDKCIEYSALGLKYEPKSKNALTNTGLSYLHKGDLLEAEKWYSKAISLYPDIRSDKIIINELLVAAHHTGNKKIIEEFLPKFFDPYAKSEE